MSDVSIDQVKALLPQLTAEEANEIKVAAGNIQRALVAMNEVATTTTIANYRAAKEFLAELYHAKIAKYQPEQPPAAIPGAELWKTFTETKNRRDVWRFLSAHGWDLSERTFYRHVDTGKLKKNHSGLYTARAVKKYAETWAVRTSGKTVIDEEEDLAAAKTRAEIARIKTAKEREAFRLAVDKGKFLPRDEVELQLAGRAVALEAGYDHMVYTKASEFVALVGGKQENAELLIAALLSAKDEWFKSYASGEEFEVEFTGGES